MNGLAAGLASALALSAGTLPPSPLAPQHPFFEISPLNDVRLRRAAVAQEGIRFWASASPDRPPPTVREPVVYPSGPFADFRESERATIERRARAMVRHIASLPSFRGRDVAITVEPLLDRTRGKWDMVPAATMRFTVAAAGSEFSFEVRTGHDQAQLYHGQLDAGLTSGGCPRAMIEQGEDRGQEFLALQTSENSPVGGLRIIPDHDVIAADVQAVISPISAAGRALAALHALDCAELVAVANAIEADYDERLAPEF